MKIGLLATLEGPFAAGGQDGMRGAELAVKERNGMAGGKKIEIIKASSDAKPDVAVNATRKLVEQDKVADHGRPALGLRGHRGQGLLQDPARHHLHQRLVGRAGHDAGRTRRRTSSASTPKARSGWSGLGEHALDKGYKKMVADRRGLRLPVLAGAGLHGRATASRAARSSTRRGCRSAARTTPR